MDVLCARSWRTIPDLSRCYTLDAVANPAYTVNHSEYTTARARNLLTLLELGLDAGRHYPRLGVAVEGWRYSEQLNAMNERIDTLRKRVKVNQP